MHAQDREAEQERSQGQACNKDVYSRYVVGWMVAHRESATLAHKLIEASCERERIQPGQLTLHADRGSSMTSKPTLKSDIERQQLQIGELYIDRGYINSSVVDDVLARKGEVICRPWNAKNGKLFPKSMFEIDMGYRLITCPGEQTMTFQPGMVVEFDAKGCDSCPLRVLCTSVPLGRGRTISIAHDEQLQHRLRKMLATPAGRERLRKRTHVEHRLAHVARRQGPRARYLGTRKNTLDLRRAAAIQNIESWQRRAEPVLRKVA